MEYGPLCVPRLVALLVCAAQLAGCESDYEGGLPPEQQCDAFENELCAKLAYCQPPSERRDYMELCLFARSVYTVCSPVGAKAFDTCIASIREADCPATGQPLSVSDKCAGLSQPR